MQEPDSKKLSKEAAVTLLKTSLNSLSAQEVLLCADACKASHPKLCFQALDTFTKAQADKMADLMENKSLTDGDKSTIRLYESNLAKLSDKCIEVYDLVAQQRLAERKVEEFGRKLDAALNLDTEDANIEQQRKAYGVLQQAKDIYEKYPPTPAVTAKLEKINEKSDEIKESHQWGTIAKERAALHLAKYEDEFKQSFPKRN